MTEKVLRSRGASRHDTISPIERLVVVQTWAVVAATAWMMGGRGAGAEAVVLTMTSFGLGALVLAWRDGVAIAWRAFLPLAGYAAYVGLSLLNPSHERVHGSLWLPRDGMLTWLPTTIDSWLTLHGAWPWIAALAQAGWIGALVRGRRALRLLVLGIVAHTALLSVIGAVIWFGGSGKLLGLVEIRGATVFATFIYKNHWAAYGLLAACSAIGLALAYANHAAVDRRAASLRTFAISAAALILMSILLPESRSGTVLAAVVAVAGTWALARNAWGRSPEARVRGAWAAGLVVVAAAAVGARAVWIAWPSIEQGWQRSERQMQGAQGLETWDVRVRLIRDTWGMIEAAPWFGWGAGAFPLVFPVYQDVDYNRAGDGLPALNVLDAHSDWMQIPAEYGIVGLAGMLIAAGVGLRRARSRASAWPPAVASGCTLILIYATAEFPFQNPAVLQLWVVLLAAAASGPPLRPKFSPQAPASQVEESDR